MVPKNGYELLQQRNNGPLNISENDYLMTTGEAELYLCKSEHFCYQPKEVYKTQEDVSSDKVCFPTTDQIKKAVTGYENNAILQVKQQIEASVKIQSHCFGNQSMPDLKRLLTRLKKEGKTVWVAYPEVNHQRNLKPLHQEN